MGHAALHRRYGRARKKPAAKLTRKELDCLHTAYAEEANFGSFTPGVTSNEDCAERLAARGYLKYEEGEYEGYTLTPKGVKALETSGLLS